MIHSITPLSGRSKYPFSTMQDGDKFFTEGPVPSLASLRIMCSNAGKQFGKKFKVDVLGDGTLQVTAEKVKEKVAIIPAPDLPTSKPLNSSIITLRIQKLKVGDSVLTILKPGECFLAAADVAKRYKREANALGLLHRSQDGNTLLVWKPEATAK